MERHLVRRFGITACLSALSLAAIASAAAASVTIGQTGPPPMGSGGCGNGLDLIQPTVTSGNPYVVPDTGGVNSWTVTSWTTLGGGGPEQRALKIFRKVGEPATYEVVAHDGPRTLTPGGTTGNTFATALAVKSGDVLGLHMTTIGQCKIDVADSFLLATTDLGDGQSGDFTSVSGRLEVEAVIAPTNTFSLAATTRNKKTGTATLAFDLPNPGQLGGAAKGAKISPVGPGGTGSVTAPGSGPSQLLIKAKGKRKKKLNQKGKVKLNVAVTYTPTGGDPSTQSIKVKLKKKL